MNTSRIAVITATASALAWGAKAVAIGLAGGLDKSPAEGPFFLVGLVLAVVALAAVTLTALSGRPLWLRIAAVPASLAGLVLTVTALGGVIGAVAPSDHWAWYELNLWVFAAVVLGLALRLDRRVDAEVVVHGPVTAGYGLS